MPHSESLEIRNNVAGCASTQHEIISLQTDAKHIPWLEVCRKCGWVDHEALDRSAESAIKTSGTQRAQLIAAAASTEPFAFVQMSGEELTPSDVLYQALGAASMLWEDVESAGQFNTARAASLGRALEAEVDRFMSLAMDRRERAVRESEVKDWSDLAAELYGLACNSQSQDFGNAKAGQDWNDCFVRLRDRFHELLPGLMEELRANGGDQEAGVGRPDVVPGADGPAVHERAGLVS